MGRVSDGSARTIKDSLRGADMQDAAGREMARLGSATDHGGQVIEATEELTHMGIAVALDGHGVSCPKCRGVFPLLASGPRSHRGKRIGYVGDKTGCGATVTGA
jgi:uncharacterized Zn-binding protein involved in type VI secretion